MSSFFNLNLIDLAKGFVMAILGTVISGLYTIINSGGKIPQTWPEWQTLLMVGLSAGLAYLVKNLFTNSKNELLAKEPKK